MGIPHVLVLPFPFTGHVNPLMNFSQKLAQHGFKVTFVNTDFNQKRVVNATNEKINLDGSAVQLFSIPDGLGPEEDRNDLAKICLAILSSMPSLLEKVIVDISASSDGNDRITAIIADVYMAWALEVGQKLGIKGTVICPTSAAVFALEVNMPKLIEDGIMDSNGFPTIEGKFQVSPGMPTMDTADIPWCCIGDTSTGKILYDYIAKMVQASHLTDWWLCNTASELESGALSSSPKILPIGPLMENHEVKSLGQFWEEDFSCLSWLDQQPPCSVIYVAFGSATIFDPIQFKELALGLELTNRPFLWVVREEANGISSTKNAYPDEFQATNCKIVKWAPQKNVLSHPAIACFISHCGWNSTMEGVSNGVPFLSWPHFADQFIDKAYICDVWKVGLGFDLDDNGFISRWEIKKKVDLLLGDKDIRERSKKLKEMVKNNIAQGGQSSENFSKFKEWLKE